MENQLFYSIEVEEKDVRKIVTKSGWKDFAFKVSNQRSSNASVNKKNLKAKSWWKLIEVKDLHKQKALKAPRPKHKNTKDFSVKALAQLKR